MGVEEEIDEQLGDRRPVMADAPVAIGAHGRVRALAGERRQAGPLRLQLPELDAEHRVAAQVIVVDQVLVAERDAEHPLADQRGQLVSDAPGRTPVAEKAGEALHQPDRPVGRAQEQRAGIRTDRAAVEIGHQLAAIEPCKQHRFRAPLRLRRGRSSSWGKSFSQKNFPTIRSPMHLSLVRNELWLNLGDAA